MISIPRRRPRALPPLLALIAAGSLAFAGCASAAASGSSAAVTGSAATSTTAAPALASLEVRSTVGGCGPLEPAFSPGVRSYRVLLEGDLDTVDIIAEPASGSSMSIDELDVASGEPYRLGVEPGTTAVKLLLKGEGGASAEYTVEVEREDFAPLAAKFSKASFVDPATGFEIGYRLYVPEKLDAGKKYPLVLFLHGAGEIGDDGERHILLNQGALVWTRPEEQAERPCFVLAPQCPKSATGKVGANGWTSLMSYGFSDPFAPELALEAAWALLQRVASEQPVDGSRIYATGMSMGGFGTFAIAAAHPGAFAAIVPVCGGMDPEAAASLAPMPIWIFHAADDPAVSIDFARDAVKALGAAGGSPKYTEYPSEAFFMVNAHFSWIPAYADAGMRAWLFAQRLGGK